MLYIHSWGCKFVGKGYLDVIKSQTLVPHEEWRFYSTHYFSLLQGSLNFVFLWQYETSLECKSTKFMEALPADERGDLKVTGKNLCERVIESWWKHYVSSMTLSTFSLFMNWRIGFFDRYRVKFHLLFLYLFIVKVFLCKLLPPSTLKEGIEKGEWFMICKYGCPTYYFVLFCYLMSIISGF